ncbi:MAG: hypothetical protein R3F30_12800 [Planctomycetota bacterium]
MRAAPAVVLVLLASCSGPRVDGGRSVPPPGPEAPTRPLEPVGPPVELGSLYSAGLPDLDPRLSEGDTVLARIGDLEVRKHHVLDRMLEQDPAQVQALLELIVLDERIRELAARYGVEVPATDLRLEVARDWARLVRRMEQDGVPKDRIEEQLELRHGLDKARYLDRSRRMHWRRLLRSYTLRYWLRRSGSVTLRFFAAASEDEALAVRGQAQQGADLEALCRQSSIDPSGPRGGLLPPLPPGFAHPGVALAEGLAPDGLSAVRAVRLVDGREAWGFVQVIERREPDRRPFAEQAATIRAGLERRPVEGEELQILLSGPQPAR